VAPSVIDKDADLVGSMHNVHFQAEADKAINEYADERAASDKAVPVKSYIESFVEWFGAASVSDDAIDETPSTSLLKSIAGFFMNDPEGTQDVDVAGEADLSPDATVLTAKSFDTPHSSEDESNMIHIIDDVSTAPIKDNFDEDVTKAGRRSLFTPSTTGVKITASDIQSGDNFGHSVAMTDTIMVIGAPLDDDGAHESGSVYIYEKDSSGDWTEKQKISDPEPGPHSWNNFGMSVAISESGNTIAVGKPYDELGASQSSTNHGSVHLFARQGDGTYTHTAKIVASDPAPEKGDEFGRSVAVSDTLLVVGAYWKDIEFGNQGAVYVYDIDQSDILASEKQLTASDRVPYYNEFGWSVDLSGDTIIVGARYGGDGGNPDSPDYNLQEGGAYIYEKQSDETWDETIIDDENWAVGDYLGFGVSISGDIAVVGAPMYPVTGRQPGAGKAIVLERNNAGAWNIVQTLTPSDGQDQDNFGVSVSMSGNFIVVAAPNHDVNGISNAGKAYVFERVFGTWIEIDKLIATDPQEVHNSFGVYNGAGAGVCVKGETVVIGSPYIDGGAGAAYMYSIESLDPNKIPSMAPSAAASEVPSSSPSDQPSSEVRLLTLYRRRQI
jgi:hypothetical protein